MITDLFFSFHKLLRKRQVVKWHVVPLLTVWYLFIIILKNWWDLTTMQNLSDWINIAFLLAYGHMLLVVFLTVSAALPDEIPDGGIDLRKYYTDNQKYFWSLMTIAYIISLTTFVFKQYYLNDSINILNFALNSLFLVFTVSLIFIKNLKFHGIVIVILLLQIILEVASKIK